MRFLVADDDGASAVYVLRGEREAVNLTRQDPEFGADLTPLTALGQDGLERARALQQAPGVALAGLTPRLPIARPGKVYCLGLNYVDHAKEGGYEVPDYPALFMRASTSLLAAGAPIVRPDCSEKLDYEAELLVIVGRGGRHIDAADALSHVFGYTVFNDGSVRDYQRKTHQWTPGKNFDATGPLGPVVVTPDELPDGARDLRICSRLNGKVMQDANTSDMMFGVAHTIATLSEFSTLEPGDLIAMGTPPGVGHARRPPVWMKPGDEIEVEIEGIGICRNPIVAERAGT